jgi:hypothetical protein
MKLNPGIKKVVLNYGSAGGLMLIMAFTVFYFLDQQPWRNLISFFLDAVIIGFFLVLAIRAFKVTYNHHELRFYHGMTIGFLTFTMMAAIYAMAFAIFVYVISPDFIDTYIDLAIEDFVSRRDILTEDIEGDPDEFMAEQIAAVRSITRSQIVLDLFLKRVLIGFFLTPVISIVFRTPQS